MIADIIKKYAVNYINNMFHILIYVPELLCEDYRLDLLLNNKLDNKINLILQDNDCMLCLMPLNNEIINYKCVRCNCYLHHSCANEYFCKHIIFKCIVCKLDHTDTIKQKYLLCAYWNDDGIIVDIKLEEMQRGYHYSIIKIAYKDETIKNLIYDFVFTIYKKNKLIEMYTIMSNNQIIHTHTYESYDITKNIYNEGKLIRSSYKYNQSYPELYNRR